MSAMSEEQLPPRVDIIILTWNGLEDTIECLESLKSIDYPEYRITLVDNGSTDGTGETIRERFPEVNYIYSDTNLRFAGGNNLALSKTLDESFDFALLLNNDTVVEPDFLTRMVETALSDSAAGLVGAKIYYYDHPDTIWFAGGKANIKIARMRHRGIGEIDDGRFDEPCECTFLNGACLLIRCELLREIGLLDEDFFLYGEDLDFCLRAIKSGYKLYYQPQARIKHKVSRSTPALKKLQFRYRSWLLLMKKHTALCWRPLQYLNLLGEFFPLVIGFIRRKIIFAHKK